MNIKEIWEQFGERAGTTIFHPQFFAKQQAADGRRAAVSHAKGVVLDIGPGRAPYRAAILAKKSVKQYLTLDHPQAARFYSPQFPLDYTGDASEKLPLRRASVDTVILLMVLEHLPNPQRALTEIGRVLRPGGILIASTIQTYPLHDGPYDYFRYTEFALRSLIEKAGLKLRRIQSGGNFATTIAILANVQMFQALKYLSRWPLGLPFAILCALPAILFSITLNLFGLVFGIFDPIQRLRHSHTLIAYKRR